MARLRFLVTGGAGFIGSAVVRLLLNETPHEVLNLDKLTYAGNLASLAGLESHPRYQFAHGDICDGAQMEALLRDFAPHRLIHLAAESHVDRSVDGPEDFIQTNIVGTYRLLEAALNYHSRAVVDNFRFHHVSTDEVFGSLGEKGLFDESTPYQPRSPYSASKAASDHLVMAWHHTYGLPIVMSNCSNNYGPFQFPEKLIPLMTLNALDGQTLPVYGNGAQVRDWLFVEDHARAIYEIAIRGTNGHTYNVGGNCEQRNIDVVHLICDLVAEQGTNRDPHALIEHVADRPGHDLRYAVDTSKITRELGWRPQETLATGLRKTVDWYARNRGWTEEVTEHQYDGSRLGLMRRET